jgi:hypothetical protein
LKRRQIMVRRAIALVLLTALTATAGTLSAMGGPEEIDLRAISREISRESLRGLPGCSVAVELLTETAKDAGLTRVQLQTDVELRLGKAGIRVLSEKEAHETDCDSYLYVNVNTNRVTSGPATGLVAGSISVCLRESVRLMDRPGIVHSAITWEKSVLGTSEAKNLQPLVRNSVAYLVDLFANDYLAANPDGPEAESERLRGEIVVRDIVMEWMKKHRASTQPATTQPGRSHK